MKRIIILIGFFLLIVTGLFVTSLLINWESYKGVVVSSIKSATGRDVVIKGTMSGSLLPLPHIIIPTIQISNAEGGSTPIALEAKSVTGYFSLMSLLGGEIHITEIVLDKATIQLEMLESGAFNWDFSGNTAKNTTPNRVLPQEIYLTNSTVILRKNSSQFLKTFAGVDAEINVDSPTGPFSGKGSFVQNDAKIDFSTNLQKLVSGENTGFSWQVGSSDATVSFEGNLAKKDNKYIIGGKLAANIENLKRFADNVLGALVPVLPAEIQEKVNVAADLNISGQEVSLENLAVTSNNIKGSGHIRASFDATPIIDTILTFDTINIDALTKPVVDRKKNTDKREMFKRNKRVKYTEITFPNNVNALLYLTVKKIIYHGQVIENLTVNSDLFNGVVEIYPSTIQLPGNAKLEVSGSISSNGVRPAFDGEVISTGDNLDNIFSWLGVNRTAIPIEKLTKFDIKTQLNITPKEFRLTNMDVTVDDHNVSGLFNVRYGGGTPEINMNLVFNAFNMDDKAVATYVDTFLQPFINNADNEVGTDFQWLRKLPVRIGGEIFIGELQYNKRVFTAPLFIFQLAAGTFKCNKVTFNSDLEDFTAEALLDIRALRPKINLSIKGKKFDTAMFSPPAAVKAQPVEADKTKSAMVKIFTENKSAAKWSSEEFSFPRIDKFSGVIQVAVDSFVHQKIELKGLNIASRIADGVLVIDNLRAEMFNGILLAKGGIGSTPPSISVSFSLSNALLNPFLQMFTSIDTLSGYFSISGSYTTQGKNPVDWAAGTQMAISLAVRDLIMQNMDIDRLVDLSNTKELLTTEHFYTLVRDATSQGTTTFRNVDSKISADKGIMQINPLTFDTARTRGILSGSVDIKNWVMNTAAKIAFIPKVGDGPLSIDLALAGAVEKPEKKFDVKALENYVVVSAAPVAPTKAEKAKNANMQDGGNPVILDPTWDNEGEAAPTSPGAVPPANGMAPPPVAPSGAAAPSGAPPPSGPPPTSANGMAPPPGTGSPRDPLAPPPGF